MRSTNTVWQKGEINRSEREKLLGQKAALLWFTGLSGSGKSTIAYALEQKLIKNGNLCYVLDGDNIRQGLNGDLNFSHEDRIENIRRIGEVGKLFVEAGLITLAAFISPYRKVRKGVREKLKAGQFIEIFIKCSLEECEMRDVKGLYKKARTNEIADFTGIHYPYEEPDAPEIVIDTQNVSVKQAIGKIFQYLKDKKIIEVV